MARNKKYYPDYAALYPDTVIPKNVLNALNESDQKIKYMEYDLKREWMRKDSSGVIISFIPSREDSYERLLEMDKQFAGFAPSPEQTYFERERNRELYKALALLDTKDRALIVALFFDGFTVRKYAQMIGVSRYAVYRHKQRILCLLKKYFANLRI